MSVYSAIVSSHDFQATCVLWQHHAAQELSVLLPGMSSQRLLQLDRVLLAQLASDTSGA